ncbi:response regulator [Desulfocurvus sp.]|jgi:DNA-binding NtrC family response regulator|uniref:response regulator n=1 Tax=Desulfocurvus sp. TaxID=2871698 RepID=UPI0025C34A9A|nr:response regulator [Desulfocurvus sp.]MCK9240566.1 response regulator [Desulfocurvus sp.]
MSEPIRVLVVDDDQSFRTNMTELLNRQEGISAACAESGDAALEVLAREAYDVVLLDMLMPGLSAHGTVREMRRRGLGAAVIVVTGHASVDDAVEMINLGAYDYLLKPCTIKEIVQKVTWAQEWRRLQPPQ